MASGSGSGRGHDGAHSRDHEVTLVLQERERRRQLAVVEAEVRAAAQVAASLRDEIRARKLSAADAKAQIRALDCRAAEAEAHLRAVLSGNERTAGVEGQEGPAAEVRERNRAAGNIEAEIRGRGVGLTASEVEGLDAGLQTTRRREEASQLASPKGKKPAASKDKTAEAEAHLRAELGGNERTAGVEGHAQAGLEADVRARNRAAGNNEAEIRGRGFVLTASEVEGLDAGLQTMLGNKPARVRCHAARVCVASVRVRREEASQVACPKRKKSAVSKDMDAHKDTTTLSKFMPVEVESESYSAHGNDGAWADVQARAISPSGQELRENESDHSQDVPANELLGNDLTNALPDEGLEASRIDQSIGDPRKKGMFYNMVLEALREKEGERAAETAASSQQSYKCSLYAPLSWGVGGRGE